MKLRDISFRFGLQCVSVPLESVISQIRICIGNPAWLLLLYLHGILWSRSRAQVPNIRVAMPKTITTRLYGGFKQCYPYCENVNIRDSERNLKTEQLPLYSFSVHNKCSGEQWISYFIQEEACS